MANRYKANWLLICVSFLALSCAKEDFSKLPDADVVYLDLPVEHPLLAIKSFSYQRDIHGNFEDVTFNLSKVDTFFDNSARASKYLQVLRLDYKSSIEEDESLISLLFTANSDSLKLFLLDDFSYDMAKLVVNVNTEKIAGMKFDSGYRMGTLGYDRNKGFTFVDFNNGVIYKMK
ncbi:hypothetical protein GC194_05625 [bacterium]|nr:hypothetical protein [bacterium]